MQNNWLTVDLVDDIQLAMKNHRSVSATIKSLQNTTLPGFIQYKCLVWTTESHLDTLPKKIAHSKIAKAFQLIKNHLKVGQDSTPVLLRTVACRTVEFSNICRPEHLNTKAWELFETRFNRSAKKVGLPSHVADLLQAALHEMAENALIHSHSAIPIIVAYHALDGFAQFCVADLGIGVLNSLRTCPDYQTLNTHNDAIRKALQDGVSRYGYQHGGFGFRSVFKAVASQWGVLRFRSGEAAIFINGTDCDADKGLELFLPFLPGFQVAISCYTDQTKISNPVV